jgi:thioesterase domain-containing protein
MTPAERAAALQARVRAAIPLAAAMQVSISGFDGARVCLVAPLAANINDKGTAFAGSLSTLATLSGWCLATLLGEAGGEHCEAAVVHSELDFLKPVRGELRVEAWLADAAELAQLEARLAARRRARIRVQAVIGDVNDPALRFRGDYAVWVQGSQPF